MNNIMENELKKDDKKDIDKKDIDKKDINKKEEDEKEETNNQETFLNYKPFDFKDVELQAYTLKINSKDRNIFRELNPFNFEINFNQQHQLSNPRALITSKFENIKRITVNQLIIPRYIPRNYIGEPVTGITPLYNTISTVSLSFYPGININNTVLSVLDISGNQIKVEVVELVDLANKKLYIIPLHYNNPYYLTKYITVKAELFSYLNINDNIYPILNIDGNILTLGNTTNFPIPPTTNNRLILADYYKNTIMIDNDGTKIGINKTEIQINNANISNFQFIYSGHYLEYQVNSSFPNIFERKIFKVTHLNFLNSNLIIYGSWTDGLPFDYDNSNLYFSEKFIKLNIFNYGVRDLVEEKIFYLNLSPFGPSKSVSTDPTVDNSFGILYPANSSKDYLYLKGDAIETYMNSNLQNTSNKIKFSLMDSNNLLIGEIYKLFPNLYNPNNISILSYLPFNPEIIIILKIEEVVKKFNNIG